MKNTSPFLIAFLLTAVAGAAQTLPVRSVTVFKNNKSLIQKSGAVAVKNGKWSTTDLPAALFGTFWVTSPSGELASVFSRQDSVEVKAIPNDNTVLLEKNIGKPVTLLINMYNNTDPMTVSGTVEKVEKIKSADPGFSDNNYRVHLRTTTGRWMVFGASQIVHMDFAEKPALDFEPRAIMKKAQAILDVNFKNDKSEQEIGMLYLTNNLGWTPVYSLSLTEKGKSRLSLRAEIANDAEDLGNAELRLAVGNPNFSFADRPDWLVDFARRWQYQDIDDYRHYNALAIQTVNYTPSTYGYEEDAPPPPGENFEGGQAEDFFFYTVRPGNFPKNSRYQYPIFETEVEPAHFYECQLAPGGPGIFPPFYEQQRRNPNEPKNPVSHYIEFANPTQYPFTTGAVNILSQSNGATYPLSQDKLPYTPPTAICKVKIAHTPEIKVTHSEGDVERRENSFLFFSRNYDEVKAEGHIHAVNYKKETVTLRIRRSMEGTPLSSEHKWTLKQEQATLRVNPAHELEWIVELKPGEEKKWKYSYKVYVDY